MSDAIRLAELLERRLGFDPDSVGAAQWQRALASRARQLGLDLAAYVQRAGTEAGEQVALLVALNIDESWLCRDPAQLAAIRTWLGAQDPDRPLSLLCAPCARGEEAWSLAALLQELTHRRARASILALDLSPAAIAQARLGRLPRTAWRENQAPPRWVLPADSGWQIDPGLKPLVHFEVANLLDWQPPPGVRFDLVCSRNFLIYLSAAARARWLERVAAWLVPDGSLWLARAERPAPLSPGWRPLGDDGGWSLTATAAPEWDQHAEARPVRTVATKSRRASAPAGVQAPPKPLSRQRSPDPIMAGEGAGTTTALRAPVAVALADALQAMQRDDLAQAEALLRQVLYLDHGCEEAVLHLAALRTRQGDPEEARRLHARLRRQSPVGART